MVALRSRRLERLFGTRLERLAHAQVADLVTNAVAEAYDLDFKATLYGRSDKERRDLAGDVAALANTGGGVIVLGIAEDNQTVPPQRQAWPSATPRSAASGRSWRPRFRRCRPSMSSRSKIRSTQGTGSCCSRCRAIRWDHTRSW
jgi:hypothetical protein